MLRIIKRVPDDDRPNACPECQLPLEERVITHNVRLDEHERFDIDNVPALVCPGCQATWLSSEAMEVIDHIVATHRGVN